MSLHLREFGKMKSDKKKKLYRERNFRQRWDEYNYHPKYSWKRHSKQAMKDLENEITHEGMTKSKHGDQGEGYDYTPMFKFVLKHIGEDVDKIYSEVCRRTNERGKYLFNVLVSRKPKDELNPLLRLGETSFWSQLYVDENNKIQKVEPNMQGAWITYGGQWGQSFNGKSVPFRKGHNLWGRSGSMYERTGKMWY